MGSVGGGKHHRIGPLMPLASPQSELLLALDPAPDAARAARHALRARRLDPDLDHTVALLTSEVVGNAVRHTGMGDGEQILFFARIGEDHIHVEVADRGPCFDPDIRHEADGFGLRLVDKLASDWGVERTENGCRVWFDVDRRSGRFARDGSAD
jgi:anti-sigma regulatory factor (Ser/Thr protein kinase)